MIGAPGSAVHKKRRERRIRRLVSRTKIACLREQNEQLKALLQEIEQTSKEAMTGTAFTVAREDA